MRSNVIQGSFVHPGRTAPLRIAPSPSPMGQPLPAAVRQKMEAFFHTSFTDVRVHVGTQAQSIGALAYTNGSDIYFAPGHYAPATAQGKRMLGHELAHVVQQRSGRVRNPFGNGMAVVRDIALEMEADRLGNAAAVQCFGGGDVVVIPRPVPIPDPIVKPIDSHAKTREDMEAEVRRYLERYLREHGYYPWERHLHEDPPSRRSEYKPTVDPKRQGVELMQFLAARRQLAQEAENRRQYAERWQKEWGQDIHQMCDQLRGNKITGILKGRQALWHGELVNRLERSLRDPNRPASEARDILQEIIDNYPTSKEGHSKFSTAMRNYIYERIAAKIVNSRGFSLLRPGVPHQQTSKNKKGKLQTTEMYPDYATLTTAIGDALGLQLNPREDIAARIVGGVQSKVTTYPDHDVVVVLDVHGISASALLQALPAIRRGVARLARRPARVYIILGSLIFEA